MGAQFMNVIEPATEQVLAELPRAGEAETDAAIAKAKAAQGAWSAISPSDRSRLLRRMAGLIECRREELAELEARNVGKPISDAVAEVGLAADTFAYFSGAPERLLGSTIPVAGGVDLTFREPLGVVGLITPWNFPLAISSWKLAPALAGGNTVVLKPAELTPLTAIQLERLSLEAGLPEGVVNVVVGPGSVCGQRLVEHPDVAKIAFTGSTEVGQSVYRGAAERVKRIGLELGGKSANIVFADADVDAAARAAPMAVFGNAGQDCCARSRILVERPVLEQFVDVMSAEIDRLRVGDPLDPSTQMGPLISSSHRDQVGAFIDDSTSIITSGHVPDGPGFWFPPMLVEASGMDDRLAETEIFGPIAVVLPFEGEQEAIRAANATIYGLSGSIWTKDGARALRVARAVESGALSVNSNTAVRVQTPFGGFKLSGLGRDLGPDAVHEYTELKNIFFAT